MGAHLHCHDQTTGHVPHLIHHAIGSAAQLTDQLQVVCLHLKVLRSNTSHHHNTAEQTAAQQLLSFFTLFEKKKKKKKEFTPT